MSTLSSASNTGAAPEWQHTIRARLMAQQAAVDPLRDVIEQCERDRAPTAPARPANRL